MSAAIDVMSRWNGRFLPSFALIGPDYPQALACAAIIAVMVSLSILLTWLIGRAKPAWLKRYAQTINSATVAIVIILSVLISMTSRNVPFAPIYIAAGLLTYCLAIFALGTNYWILLRRCGGLPAPYFLQLRSVLWLNLVMSSFIFIPPLLFQMPAFDRSGSTLFWGTPVAMFALYAAYLWYVLPNALDLLGLRLQNDELGQGHRDILGRFLEGGGKKKYEIIVARRGLLNAIAFFARKKSVIIGVDLLDNLEEEEVRAILLHEEGHLQDLVFVKSLGRLALMIPALVLLFSMYFGTDLPGRGLPALILFLLLVYLVSLQLRRVRLRGELAADAYVKSKGEEVYQSHLSGIEKLYRMGGVDKDICKRMNLAHLDLDERRDLVAEGGTALPKRPVKRGVGALALWLVFGVLIGALIYNVPLTASARWRKAHNDFHDLMYTESGDKAIATIRRAVVMAEESFGPRSKKLSTSLTDLTEALTYYDRYDEARNVGSRAVKVAEGVYGTGDPEFVRSLKNMGEIHYWREEYGTSREWFDRALEIQKSLEDEDSAIIDTLEWLSWTWEDEENWGKAVDLHREMLERYAGDSESAYEAAKAAVRMGTFLGLAGERAEGDLVHRQTLSGAKEDFGEQSETYVELLLEVGHALCSRGETERAEQYFSRGLEILDALGERLYLHGDSTLQRMALCYRDAGDEGKAIAAYEELLDGRVKDKGALDMDDAGELWGLAEAHENRGSLDDAARYYMRLAEMGEQAGGMDNELLKRTYVKIIAVTTRQGDLEKAEEYRARGERLPGWNGQ